MPGHLRDARQLFCPLGSSEQHDGQSCAGHSSASSRWISPVPGSCRWLSTGRIAVLAIFAAVLAEELSYRRGVLIGLAIYIIGALLYIPACIAQSFDIYFIAIFIVAGGCSLLETTCNPYVLSLGDQATAVRRLNFAQMFNPLGSMIGIVLAQQLILSTSIRNGSGAGAMDPATRNAIIHNELFWYMRPVCRAVCNRCHNMVLLSAQARRRNVGREVRLCPHRHSAGFFSGAHDSAVFHPTRHGQDRMGALRLAGVGRLRFPSQGLPVDAGYSLEDPALLVRRNRTVLLRRRADCGVDLAQRILSERTRRYAGAGGYLLHRRHIAVHRRPLDRHLPDEVFQSCADDGAFSPQGRYFAASA